MEPTEQIETNLNQVETSDRLTAEIEAAADVLPVVVVDTEPQINDLERERWIWTFEKLKSAEIGLSLSEKVKIFCEANTPDEVERFLQAQLDEQNIIPLAA